MQGDLRRGVIDLTRLEAQCGRIGQQTDQDGCGWCRDESGLLPSIEDVSGATESMCPHSVRLIMQGDI